MYYSEPQATVVVRGFKPMTASLGRITGETATYSHTASFRSWADACTKAMNAANRQYAVRFVAVSCGKPSNIKTDPVYSQFQSEGTVWFQPLANN